MASKKLTLTQYLGTLSMSSRSLYTVKVVLNKFKDEENAVKEWDKVMKTYCKKIVYTKPTSKSK